MMGMLGRLGKAVLAERRSRIGGVFVRSDAGISRRQPLVNLRARIHTAVPLGSTPVPALCRRCWKIAIPVASAIQSP
jgi:hypothetical protein